MTVAADALEMLADDGKPQRLPGDFARNHQGAPWVSHPTEVTKAGKPKRVLYGRPSSFGNALDSPYNLLKWRERQLLIGASILRPDWLGYDVHEFDAEDRDKLDALAACCYDAAETSLAADRGTHIHLLLEHADKSGFIASLFDDGERLGIPRGLQLKIVEQWIAFRQRLGVTVLAVEQTVVNDRWRLAGTLDRLDVTSEPILTAYGILDGAFVGDIKTGGLTVGTDGQPNYWVKYPVQLAAYVDAVPYNTDTDERLPWQDISDCCTITVDGDDRPNPDIALIYHYDLARALAGEVVDWQAIPVNVAAGREGGDLCRAAADFGKRRDLFAMPAPHKEESCCDATSTSPDPIDSSPSTMSTRAETPTAPANTSGFSMRPSGQWPENQSTPTHSVESVDLFAVPVSPVTVEQPAPSEPLAELIESDPDYYLTPGKVVTKFAVPVSPVTVEQPAVDPRPDTASPPVAVSAADRNRLITRIKDLLRAHPNAESEMRRQWPEDVPTLKHDGHTPEQLALILAVIRNVESLFGASWHPDDGPQPRSRAAIKRAVDAWAGRDPGTAWFAASLIATFEQCRNADSTFEDLVAQFSIEQCDRLYDAAQSTSHDWHSGHNATEGQS